MASTALVRTRHTEADWLQHQSLIRSMYIDQKSTLQQVKESLAAIGFNVTKSQLEYKCKTWGFTKKMKKGTGEQVWQYVGFRIAKRQRDGKRSRVIMDGRIVDCNKVTVETRRYEPVPCAYDYRDDMPRTPEDALVSISTPPRIWTPWPPSLAWLKFQRNISSVFPTIMRISVENTEMDFANQAAPIIWRGMRQPQLVTNTPHKIAAELDKIMPEAYDGENMQRSQLLLRGSPQDILQERIKVMFFQLSNQLHYDMTWDGWISTLRLVRLSGIIDSVKDLRQIRDETIAAALDAIFKESFRVLLRYGSSVKDDAYASNHAAVHPTRAEETNQEEEEIPRSHISVAQVFNETIQLIHWFLESGQDPNILVEYGWPLSAVDFFKSDLSLLQISALSGFSSLLQDLLNHGAIPDAFVEGASPLALALENLNEPYDTKTPQKLNQTRPGKQRVACDIESLLDHGADIMLKRPFVGAAWKPLHFDKFLCKRRRTPLKACWNALERAAGLRSEDMAIKYTDYLLDQQAVQNISLGHGGGDVLVTAASRGYDQLLSNLLDRGIPSNARNAAGFTALHSAAFEGHTGTCLYLIESGADVQPAEGSEFIPSPMHLAALRHHLDVVRILYEHGASIEQEVNFSDQGFVQTVLRDLFRADKNDQNDDDVDDKYEEFWNHSRYAFRDLLPLGYTPLGAVVAADPCGNFFQHLVGLGAKVPHWALHQACCSKNTELVLAALACGAGPNTQEQGAGLTALQNALNPRDRSSEGEKAACVQIAGVLLDHGAHLAGGEATQAILLGSLDLFERLRRIQISSSLPDTEITSSEMTWLAAAILSQSRYLLHQVVNVCPTSYDPSAICAAIFVGRGTGDGEFVRDMLKKRNTADGVLEQETAAICIASWLGDVDILRLLLLDIPATEFICVKKSSLLGRLIEEFRHRENAEGQFSTPPHITRWETWDIDKFVEISPLYFALRSSEALSRLVDHGYRPDRLTLAEAADSIPGTIEILLRYGNILDTELPIGCDSAVAQAISQSDLTMLRMLLEAEGSPDSCGDPIFSPLVVAVTYGHLDAARVLIDLGADCNGPSRCPPLIAVAIVGHIGIARLLITHGADINVQARGGRNALAAAARAGRLDMVQFLLCEGARTMGDDREREDYIAAVKSAKQRGYAVVEKVLREHREWTEEDHLLYDKVDERGMSLSDSNGQDIEVEQSHVAEEEPCYIGGDSMNLDQSVMESHPHQVEVDADLELPSTGLGFWDCDEARLLDEFLMGTEHAS